jgi:GT2 family glycosyltransferase
MTQVLVSIVTFNDGQDLTRCLEGIRQQAVSCQVRVFDNASRDSCAAVAKRFGVDFKRSTKNLGYSAGHNANLGGEPFDYVLFLNADVLLLPGYLERTIEALQNRPAAGSAGGKLLRMDAAGRPLQKEGYSLLDSTGIYFTPFQRHFDRGSQQADQGQYSRPQMVFGITGAALLCRREMVEDVRSEGEFFDEDFFAYREDADLAWRAQLRGWNAVYEPQAEALHRRSVLPERRRQLEPLINYHSLKNRFLLRKKNMDWAVFLKCFPYLWIRDAGILAYVLLRERSSLGAYHQVYRLRSRFGQKRRLVQQNRRVTPREMARWFSFRPQAIDL